MSTKPDDLDAIRALVSTLEPFDVEDQERILRWAREKLGLPTEIAAPQNAHFQPPKHPDTPTGEVRAPESRHPQRDIKAFVELKNPRSDIHFATTVAYYYRFDAPEILRKNEISGEDLQEACRLVGRERFNNPAKTLHNAHQGGLLDKGDDKGLYKVNTVGENLVAMTLPSSGERKAVRSKSTKVKKQSKQETEKNVKSAKIRKSKSS